MPVWLLSLLLPFLGESVALPAPEVRSAMAAPFRKVLRYNVYTFFVNVADTGATASVVAYRGSLVLTRFRIPIEGAVTGADVADLDGNRLPELYVYTTRQDSARASRVYGWQFLPERLATITPARWQAPNGSYRGRDSLWLTRTTLCRQVSGSPTSTTPPRQFCYRLRPSGANYQLTPD